MATTYAEKQDKKEKSINIETHVVSETKRGDRVIARQVVEKTEVKKGKYTTETFHEKLSSAGNFTRGRKKALKKDPKKKPTFGYAVNAEYRTWGK